MKKDIIDPGSNGFKSEKFLSIAILVVIIIAVGGFAIIRGDSEFDMALLRGEVSVEEEAEGEELEEDVDQEFILDEEEADEEVDDGIIIVDEDENEDEVDEAEEVAPVRQEGRVYRVKAQSGDGLTHVARRALEGHLQTNGGGEDLTAEHKVFIEDYVQRRIDHPTGWLEYEEEVSVSEALIDEAIEAAYQLSDSQLQNLAQYTF